MPGAGGGAGAGSQGGTGAGLSGGAGGAGAQLPGDTDAAASAGGVDVGTGAALPPSSSEAPGGAGTVSLGSTGSGLPGGTSSTLTYTIVMALLGSTEGSMLCPWYTTVTAPSHPSMAPAHPCHVSLLNMLAAMSAAMSGCWPWLRIMMIVPGAAAAVMAKGIVVPVVVASRYPPGCGKMWTEGPWSSSSAEADAAEEARGSAGAAPLSSDTV